MENNRKLDKLYYDVFGEKLERNIAKILIKGDMNDKRIQKIAELIFKSDRQYILWSEQNDEYAVFTGIEAINTQRKKEYNIIEKNNNIYIYYFNS